MFNDSQVRSHISKKLYDALCAALLHPTQGACDVQMKHILQFMYTKLENSRWLRLVVLTLVDRTGTEGFVAISESGEVEGIFEEKGELRNSPLVKGFPDSDLYMGSFTTNLCTTVEAKFIWNQT